MQPPVQGMHIMDHLLVMPIHHLHMLLHLRLSMRTHIVIITDLDTMATMDPGIAVIMDTGIRCNKQFSFVEKGATKTQ